MARTVGIIGLGLIGGSMAIDLKRREYAGTILGVESDPVNAAAAGKMCLADEIVPLDECVRRSDIIVIAIPVGAAVKMLPGILDLCDSDKVVIDTCSTKSQIVRAVHYHPMRSRYVATHPMAGTEYSGPWAAMPNLFDGRACIFANTEESDPRAVKTIEEMYDVLNMRPIPHIPRDLFRAGAHRTREGKGRETHIRPRFRRLLLHCPACEEFIRNVGADPYPEPRQCPARHRHLP